MQERSRPVAVALDFDRTVADTFSQAYGTRNIQTAYEYSIQDLFGSSAVSLFRAQGGLTNRAPTEIVMDLGVVAGDEVIEATEALVKQKLSYLLPEIGSMIEGGGVWPPLCVGFREFWLELQRFSHEGWIRTAIVSNGHDDFILRVFDLYGLPHPDVLVTDDDVRHRQDISPGRRHKPDPFILEIAAIKLGIARFDVYIGDNILTDGLMARNAGIEYGYFDSNFGPQVRYVRGGFRFGDWRVLIPELPNFQPHKSGGTHVFQAK